MNSAESNTRAKPQARKSYKWFTAVTARWADNDVYGHINNVVYYSYIDTAVSRLLIEGQALDPTNGNVIGLVVESGCNYFEPLTYPAIFEIGVRAANIGNSSVRYEAGIFSEGATLSAASGHFIHVYVDRITRRPVKLPEAFRNLLNGPISPQ